MKPADGAGFVDEAEAYSLLQRAGFSPPRHALVGGPLPFSPGEPVVLKGLGEHLWHKSEIGAVEFMPFGATAVITAAEAMRGRVKAAGHRWIGGLVCERIAMARTEGLPSEALVSLALGEAGWVVLCGFGGLPAEELARLAPPLRWPLAVVSPAGALEEVKAHLLGRIWLGRLRGTVPLTTERQLGDFLGSLWQLAAAAEAEGWSLLEMNPVVLDAAGVPRPLDAVGSRAAPATRRVRPPADFLSALRHPRRVALAGVSEKPGAVGRTILENLRRCPALAGGLTLIKPGPAELLGLPCVPDVAALRAAPVDLLVLALPASVAAQMLAALIAQGGGATAVALVSGGIGDGADTTGLGRQLAEQLRAARAGGRWTPAVLGPNFLGHWVPAAGLDTSFIPADKLAPPSPAGGGLVLLSQSGAFLLCRRSRAPHLRFGLGVALGNQMDVALPDVLHALADDPTCRAVAAYVEGFRPGQLLETARAVAGLRGRGVPVLMHRAGRTTAGQTAAASHTGALAGDCDLERALLERAGVRFSSSITAFDAALEWLGAGSGAPSGPVALLTNAGFESVNGSDLLAAAGLPAAALDAAAHEALAAMLARHQLAGLVVPQLPLDLTPMAGEAAFLEAAEILLRPAGVLVVGLVPFTKRLASDPAGAAAFAAALARLRDVRGKPVAVAVDAGADYADYRRAFREAGLPVFDRVETALLGLQTLR
ncbi:MAG: CoA-binding protein [Opitutales bacterium]